LKHKWPILDFKIQEVFSQSQGNELLTPMTKIVDIYIPVPFRLYKTYESNADEQYDITLAYP